MTISVPNKFAGTATGDVSALDANFDALVNFLNSGSGGPYAALTGSGAQTFAVAAAVAIDQAVNLAQADGRYALLNGTIVNVAYAAINGSGAQTFAVAAAVASDQAVNLLQVQSGFALLNGATANVFDVATAVAGGQAVNLAQADSRYALLNGAIANVFDVATAVAGGQAIPLAQAQTDFAQIGGLGSQGFFVAAAVSSGQAVNLNQADGRYAPIFQNTAPVDRLSAGDAIAVTYTNTSGHLWVDYIQNSGTGTATNIYVNGIMAAYTSRDTSNGGTQTYIAISTPPGGTLELTGVLPARWYRSTL